MADSSDPEDRLEQLSEKRVRQAWDEGKAPVGREAAGVAALACGTVALIALAPALRDTLVQTLATAARTADAPAFGLLPNLLVAPIGAAFACMLAAATGATVVTLAQTRGGFWLNLAAPDLSRLFQPQRLGRMFKKDFWIDLGLAVLKIAALGATAYFALSRDYARLEHMFRVPTESVLGAAFAPIARASAKVLTVLGLFAGAELAFTHLRFRAGMKMTREEAKREMKEDSGDPLMRSRRRKRHRELAKGRVALEVPRADALVVNPTHVAIAIRYRRGEDTSPRVTAKGKGKLAEVMRDLARENGVPIVQDVMLARLLYKKVKINGLVPAETYRAVAAVLAFVYRLTGRSQRSGGAQ